MSSKNIVPRKTFSRVIKTEDKRRGLVANGSRKVRHCWLKSDTPVTQNGAALPLGQVSHDALNTFG